MRRTILRILLVSVLHLAAFEGLARSSVHWPERLEERCGFALCLATVAAMLWAMQPAFTGTGSRAVRALRRSGAI